MDTESHNQRTGPQLRPYQTNVIDAARTALGAGGRKRIILVAPTGAGKTVIGAQVILNATSRGHRALFMVHRRELLRQAAAKLHDVGIDAGIVAPGFPSRPHQPVQVASIATLHARGVRTRRMDLPEADLVVIDEAHHATSRTWTGILDAYPNAYVVGLTATPCRGDGRGLGGIFEEIVECPDVSELVKLGYLVGTKVYASPAPDLSGVKVLAGDYNEKQLAERVNTVQLVGDVITHWLRFANGLRTLVYAVDVAHSVHLRDEFSRAGIAAGHLDGKTPTEERDEILRQFGNGTIDVLCNCAVLTEGFDCPEASCIVLAKPTKSFGLYRQMIGRGLRPSPGKTDCVVIDHAGLTVAHGFVDEPIEWALAPDEQAHRKAKESDGGGALMERKLVDCPECGASRWKGKPCQACGWNGKAKGGGQDFIDIELAELARDRTAKAPAPGFDPKEFYRQLMWLARERGYSTGWASHKYREKFGKWPSNQWGAIAPMEPDAMVRSWVRSRQISWAKSQHNPRSAMAR